MSCACQLVIKENDDDDDDDCIFELHLLQLTLVLHFSAWHIPVLHFQSTRSDVIAARLVLHAQLHMNNYAPLC